MREQHFLCPLIPVLSIVPRTEPTLELKLSLINVSMLEWDIIEERPSPWGSPCTLVAKKNGSPRFCVEYRHTLNRHIVRKSWPPPNLDSCLDAVGGVKFISTADVLLSLIHI